MARRIITVFGGSGFIGRHLVRRLAREGWIVRVAVRDPEAALFLKTMGEAGQIVPVRADVTAADSAVAVVRGASAVVNLVGILYSRGKRTFQRVHVDGAGNVARAARSAGAERLVQMSAIGADVHSDSAYAQSKALGEEEAKGCFEGATIVRPSVVFGPEDDFFNRFAQIARISPILPVFDTRLQPVYVGDVADGLARVLAQSRTAGKTYQFGGPKVLTFREIMELVMAETGRRRMLVRMPLTVASLQALVLERMPAPLLTRDQVKLLGRDNVVDAGALTLADLGVRTTAVEAVIPSYLRRYRRYGRSG